MPSQAAARNPWPSFDGALQERYMHNLEPPNTRGGHQGHLRFPLSREAIARKSHIVAAPDLGKSVARLAVHGSGHEVP